MNRIKLRVWLGVSVLVMILGVSTSLAQTLIPTAFVAWSPDGTMIAVGIDDRVDIVAVDTMTVLNSVEIDTTPVGQRTAPAWSPDGTMLGFGNGSALEIWLNPWDQSTAQLIAMLEPEIQQGGELLASSWSPDGTSIVTTTGNRLTFWNVSDFSESTSFYATAEQITDISWNDANNFITVSDISGTINTLTITDPQAQYGIFLEGFLDSSGYYVSPSATAVAWSPDDEFLAFGGEDFMIRIIPVSALPPEPVPISQVDEVVELRLSANVSDIAWHPDGAYIASAGWDGNIMIWDAVTGEQVEVISLGENVQANSVAWSPDGSQLAYGTADGIGVEIVPAPMRNEE